MKVHTWNFIDGYNNECGRDYPYNVNILSTKINIML